MEGDDTEVMAAARPIVATLLANVHALSREDPAAVERVERLLNGDARSAYLARGLLSILPHEVDADMLLNWVEGTAVVPPLPTMSALVPRSKPSATGKLGSARRDDLQRIDRVTKLTAQLAVARVEAAASASELAKAEAQVRTAVFGKVIVDLVSAFAGPLALGPLWTLMRAVSRHLQHDTVFEANLSPTERAAYEKHREERGRTSARILDLLDRHTGNVVLEIALHDAVLRTVEGHDAPFEAERANAPYGGGSKLSPTAKMVRRSDHDMRSSLRPTAQRHDRQDVIAGLVRADQNEAGAMAEDEEAVPGPAVNKPDGVTSPGLVQEVDNEMER